MIEQLAWGREWQIVYFKHPPLPAWIVESVAVISGRWPPALYLVGPLASALSLIAVWRLGCAMLGQQRALLAVLAQEGVVYFTIFTPEFNHNVVLLPLWSALGLAGYRALFAPGSQRAILRPVGMGWCARALGLLGKYTTALLLLPLLLLVVLHPRLRRAWSGPGPWLALGIALALLPAASTGIVADRLHAAAGSRSNARRVRRHWYDHIVNPLLFAVAQFGDIAAALLALVLLGMAASGRAARHWPATPLPSEQRVYLATITWAPVGLAVAASVVLGLHLKDMWGYPMWCFIGLFLMAEVVGPITAGGLQRFAIAWVVILVTVPMVFTVQQTHRRTFPAQAAAQCISRPGTRAPDRAALARRCRRRAAVDRCGRCLDRRKHRVLRRRPPIRVHRRRSGQEPLDHTGRAGTAGRGADLAGSREAGPRGGTIFLRHWISRRSNCPTCRLWGMRPPGSTGRS